MIVTAVTVFVKPENIGDFIEATISNHLESVKEKGNMRFDVLQSEEDPSRFLLYEAYETEEDAQAHKRTFHYLNWRERVAPWMAAPRQGIAHKVICPAARSEW